MYITEVLTKTTTGKVAHCCILLRESYREDDKVKTRTLANLTHCPPDDLAALRWALQHKQAFLRPADSARLVERLASDTLSAEDRARLGHLLQVLHTAPTWQKAPRSRRRGVPRGAATTREEPERTRGLPAVPGAGDAPGRSVHDATP